MTTHTSVGVEVAMPKRKAKKPLHLVPGLIGILILVGGALTLNAVLHAIGIPGY
jgi:hypothetical protein